MQIRTVCPHSFGANTYLLISGESAFIIDPAVSVARIMEAVSESEARLEGIILTHGHFDHTVSIDTLRHATEVPLYIHEHDAQMLTDGKKNAHYDFYGTECTHAPAEHTLVDGDVIAIGNESLRVMHTPGHSGGSICLIADDFIITGDTLFADSIGRCDLWSGDHQRIIASLQKLRTLPRSTTIYPGHGAPSDLGSALDNAAYYI